MALSGNLRQVLKQAAVLLAGGALGFGAVWFWPRDRSVWWMPVYLAASFVAGIVIHEAGHLLAGFAVRFTPILLIAGPVRIRRTPLGWRIDTGKLGFVGGAAVSVPTDERELVQRLTVFIAGGAVANAFAATVAVLLPAGPFGVVFALANLAFTGLALYPAAMAGVRTDGSRLRMLRRGGPDADRWVASFRVVALSFLGHRPRSWPEDWVRRATAFEDISGDDFQSAMIAYVRALDEGDLFAARGALSRAGRSLHATALIARPEYHIEAAFLAAVEGDVMQADANLAGISSTLVRQASVNRARAAREWAAGNAEEAARYARTGIAAAPADWDAGMTEVDLHWLNRFSA